MNLVGYTATALSRNDIEDTPTNKNVVDFAIVELKDLQGNLVVMYDDAEGANPETQKTCGTNGQVTFFAEVGDYDLEINGKAQRINLSSGLAGFISTKTDESVQDFIDTFALKIFQSPTDGGLTEIQTRTVESGEVYEVRKTSDDLLATIYSDAAGANEIVQNGTSNVSGSDGAAKFYVADGYYTVTVGSDSVQFVAGNNELKTPLVIVASGQSNMDGAGDGGFMYPENEKVKMFDLTTRQFRDVSYTNRIQRTNVNNGGNISIPAAAGKNNLAFSFCHKAHEETGRPVYLVIVSNGGTHIGRWVGDDASSVATTAGPWGPSGVDKPLYRELQFAVDDALALIGVDTVDVFLWHQGETKRPNRSELEYYKEDFDLLRSMLKSETWWSDNTKFVLGECIIGSYYQNSESYNDYWRSLNDNGDPEIRTVAAYDLEKNAVITNPDSVHFSGQSLYELGSRYWAAYAGDAKALAKRADPETTEYGAKSMVYDWSNYAVGEEVTIDPIGNRIVEYKGISGARPTIGGREAGQHVGGKTSCQVTHNENGTFTVNFTGLVVQDWSFAIEDYSEIGPYITKNQAIGNQVIISGTVDKRIVEKWRVWVESETSVSFTCNITPYLSELLEDNLVTVDWGDGNVDSGVPRGTQSHSYSSPYSGWVVFYAPAASKVETLRLNSGRFKSAISNFKNLEGLSYFRAQGSTNELYGDVSELPNTVGTVILAGNNTCYWDFNGIEKLRSLEFKGNNTAVMLDKLSDIKEFSSFNLGGVARDSDQIDKILIALANVKVWTGAKLVYLANSGQAARTTASDDAVATLTSKGVNVVTN